MLRQSYRVSHQRAAARVELGDHGGRAGAVGGAGVAASGAPRPGSAAASAAVLALASVSALASAAKLAVKTPHVFLVQNDIAIRVPF